MANLSGNFNIMINETREIELLRDNNIRFKRIAKDKILINSIEFMPDKLLKIGMDVQDKVFRFLLQKCPDLQKLFELFNNFVKNEDENIVESKVEHKLVETKVEREFFNTDNFKNKKVIVKGFVQSGKTNFIISASALFNFFGNKNIVIITRNSTDEQIQLLNRVKQFNTEVKSTLNTDGDFLSNSKNIFIEIGNPSRIKKITKLMIKKKKDYILFIDEVDFMDTSDTKTTEELLKLKENAYSYFGVSATIMDSILKTEDTELVILSKPENYRGIESFITRTLPNKNSVLTKKISDPIIEDDNLEDYLQEFSTKTPYFVPIYSDYHPVDTLIRVSRALDPNRRLLSYISKQYPNIPCMLYCGGGSIELYLPNITTPIKLPDGQKSKIGQLKTENEREKFEGIYHFFTSTSPSYVKEWLYENGGVGLYSHIITLAGQLASRCISYGASNFDKCKVENKLWWHLTEMYLCASNSTDQPELMQTAGRLCVSTPRGDNIPLTLYSTKEVEKDLVKAYWLQEELIDRANSRVHDITNDKPYWKLIQEIPIYNGKIPMKSRSLTKKVEYDLNQVETKNDGGYDFTEYKFDLEEGEQKEEKVVVVENSLDIEDLTERGKEVVRLLYKKNKDTNQDNSNWILASKFYNKRGKTGDQQAIFNILKGRNEVKIRLNNEFILIHNKVEKNKNRYEFKIEV